MTGTVLSKVTSSRRGAGGHFGSLRTSESDRFQPESKPEPCPEPRGTLHIVGFYLRGSALATNKTFSSRRSELFRPTHVQFWFSEGVSAYSINNLEDLGCNGRACALCVYSSQRPSQRQENETKTFSELIRLVSSPKVGPKSIPQLMGAKYQVSSNSAYSDWANVHRRAGAFSLSNYGHEFRSCDLDRKTA